MSRPCLLLVDDDAAQRRRLLILLEQDGYQVRLASSGEEALAAARASPPDLLLSDVMMSGMDGYELAMSFKGDTTLRHIPIALHSSVFNDARDRLLAEAIGVNAFFDKAISVGELRQQLRALSQTPASGATDNHFDENKFLQMRARLLSDKMGLKEGQLENERRRANNSARQLHAITDALPDLIAEVGTDYRYRYVNKAYEEWLGRSWQEIIGLHVEQLLGKEYFAKIHRQLARAMRGDKVDYEERLDMPQTGSRDLWIRYLPYHDEQGIISGVHVIASDITMRKAAESQLQRSNHCYLAMLQLNQLVSQTESEQALLDGACEIISQSADFPLTWIGRVEDNAQKQVVPVAQAGFGKDYLSGLQISWADNELGRGPTGRAIRSGTPQLAEDILHNPDYAPWRDTALRYGYASSIALPIKVEGKTVAALNIYAREAFAFDRDNIELLEKLAGDIGHGLHALHLMQERREIEESLRKANRAYRTLVQLKKSLARHHDENRLLHDVCQILIQSGSYTLAWVGYSEQDAAQTIRPIAAAGDVTHYLDEVAFSWGNNPLGAGASGKSIRFKQTIIINDIANDPDFTPWQAAALKRGYASIIAIPLKDNDRIFGTLVLNSNDINAFYNEEVTLLEEFAEELALGITALHQQSKHQQLAGELAYQRKLFEAVFRHIPDTMVITDTDHRIILCNSALIRDFGYFPEELLGVSPAQLYANELEFERQQQLRFHQQASVIHTPYTLEYRRKDGSTFQGETLGAAFRDQQKRLLGYITIVRDVSERQAMAIEHQQLEMQLQQAQKMETVGQLTGGIAHDFNNILASILGYTELALKRGCSDADVNSSHMRRYLGEIQGAGERARDIISQLLAFSRTDTSKRRLMELRPLIEETASLLGPTLSSSITLSLALAEGLPPIEADPNQLHQVLMNLCVNARDAMGGRGRIEIGLGMMSDYSGHCSACGEKFSGDYLQLTVRDSGSGIPDEVLSRMFDPFFTTKAVGKGSGLGLSMVHGIIHNHRGHIQVITSTAGTTFHIYLPISSAQATLTTAAPGAEGGGAPHVVIVDDEPKLVRFLEQLLQFHGYLTRGYGEPQAALQDLLQQHGPCDLVITDQVMPGMTGMELALQLKQQRPEVPVLLFSGKLTELSDEEAKRCGISVFLSKPVNSQQLLNHIQGLLQASHNEELDKID